MRGVCLASEWCVLYSKNGDRVKQSGWDSGNKCGGGRTAHYNYGQRNALTQIIHTRAHPYITPPNITFLPNHGTNYDGKHAASETEQLKTARYPPGIVIPSLTLDSITKVNGDLHLSRPCARTTTCGVRDNGR